MVMKIVFKIFFYIGLFALLAFLVVQLFFLDEYNELKNRYFHAASVEDKVSDKSLVIAYAFGPEDLEPTKFDPLIRSRILNFYEALVQSDRNLQIKPSLALSWGRISDTIWEFKLRPDVVFHDNSTFEADDVIASFQRAYEYKNSQLKDILDTIETIEKIDDHIIHIQTKKPDPLLVNRISTVLVFPSEMTNFDKPVGTGPYQYSPGDLNNMTLKRFNTYWGKTPYYREVSINTIPNRFNRLDALKNGDVHILANVPPSFADELKENPAVIIDTRPSLEVNFLIFNMESDIFKDIRMREAVAIAFDKTAFVEFSNGYAKPSNQFVSNGIFGFNPDVKGKDQNINKAKKIIREYDPFKRPSITIDMIEGAEVVGDFIREQLNEIGVSANINILSWDELKQKITNKESEMYYLGWRSELGDASDFFENAVFSQGSFNGGNYLSKKVDQLIALSLRNLEQKKRLEQLHEIMQIIVEEDIIGVPLFESDVIYGSRVGVNFIPRLDGYILACEVS